MKRDEVMDKLGEMTRDLGAYVEKRAGEVSAPVIAAEKAAADERVRAAEFEVQRMGDLVGELRRQLAARDRQLEKLAARRKQER